MLIETALALTLTVLACDDHPTPEPAPEPEALPSGPNLKTLAPSDTEPREIVYPTHIAWAPDGSLVHYRLTYENRKRVHKVGKVVLGFFVDVSTGKTLRTYQVEQRGYLEPALRQRWDAARPRAWGEALRRKLALVPASKTRTRAGRKHRGTGRLRLLSATTPVGGVPAWRLSRWFAWHFNPYKRSTKAGDKLDPWLRLQYRPRGQGRWQTLHRRRPELDYHQALGHKHIRAAAREREETGEAMDRRYCQGEDDSLDDKCEKELSKRLVGERHGYAYTGQVWIYWSPQADAVLTFWDDKQLREADTEEAVVVYRSQVTVHALKARAPSTLVPQDPPPSAATPPVAQVAAKRPKTSPGAMSGVKSYPALQLDQHSRLYRRKKPATQSLGCGCRSSGAGAGPGLALALALLLGLALYRRRR